MYDNVLTARVTVVTQKGIGRCIIVVGELLYNTLLVPVLTRFFRGWVVGVGGLEPMTSKFMFYIKKNIQKYRRDISTCNTLQGFLKICSKNRKNFEEKKYLI